MPGLGRCCLQGDCKQSRADDEGGGGSEGRATGRNSSQTTSSPQRSRSKRRLMEMNDLSATRLSVATPPWPLTGRLSERVVGGRSRRYDV